MIPPGFSFGAPLPPQQPISPFQPMGMAPIGMSFQQMQMSMMPQAPQLPFGPMVQQAANIGWPMLQMMMGQQQMARGMLPTFGTGSPFENMRQFMFQSTLQNAMQIVQQRDLARALPFAQGVFQTLGATEAEARNITGLLAAVPGAAQLASPVISRFLPNISEANIARGLAFATRGQIGGGQVAGISEQLFRQLSVGGAGERLDPALTGGLGGRDIGGLVFEFARRNALNFIPTGQAREALAEAGGTRPEQVTTGQIQRLQAGGIRQQIEGVRDVIQIIREMMGPNAPITQIVQAMEAIAGTTLGQLQPGRLRQQFRQLQGVADVLGIAPQAMLQMAQANVMQFEAAGLPANLALAATTTQIAQISAAEATFQGAPAGFAGVTRGQIARGAAGLQARGIQSQAGRMLGIIRALQAGGFVSQEQIEGIVGGGPEAVARAISTEPGRRRILERLGRIVPGGALQAAFGAEQGQVVGFLGAADLEAIAAAQGLEIEQVLRVGLGDPQGAALGAPAIDTIINKLRSGQRLTPDEQFFTSLVPDIRQLTGGTRLETLLAVTGAPARRRAQAVREAAGIVTRQRQIVTGLQRAGPQGVLDLLRQKPGAEFGDILTQALGGAVNIEALLAAGASPDILERFKTKLEAIEADETLTAEQRKTEQNKTYLTFARSFAALPAELVQRAGGNPEQIRELAVEVLKGTKTVNEAAAALAVEDRDTAAVGKKTDKQQEDREELISALRSLSEGIREAPTQLSLTINIDGEEAATIEEELKTEEGATVINVQRGARTGAVRRESISAGFPGP